MKKKYETAEIEVIELTEKDIFAFTNSEESTEETTTAGGNEVVQGEGEI